MTIHHSSLSLTLNEFLKTLLSLKYLFEWHNYADKMYMFLYIPFNNSLCTYHVKRDPSFYLQGMTISPLIICSLGLLLLSQGNSMNISYTSLKGHTARLLYPRATDHQAMAVAGRSVGSEISNMLDISRR